jgi:hypothetical protein
MEVDLSTTLHCTTREAIARVRSPRVLSTVSYPLVTFLPLVPSAWPEQWAEGRYWVAMRLFGMVPLGRQALEISYPSASVFTLRDHGHSRLIRCWDHVITVEGDLHGARYRDQLRFEAGVLTPLVWLFAQIFYRHRQRRWRQLARRGFEHAALG